MNSMEGRWGRRIFGTVTKGPVFTVFRLDYETREERILTCIIRVPNADLKEFDRHYQFVLDKMTAKIEEELNHTQGDQPC